MRSASIWYLFLLFPFAVESCAVRRMAIEAPSLISYFNARPRTVRPGQQVTLSWKVSREATEVTIDADPRPAMYLWAPDDPAFGEVPNQGTLVVTPERTTTYVLDCIGKGWEACKSQTVRVVVHSTSK